VEKDVTPEPEVIEHDGDDGDEDDDNQV
jgi:hypothetical protein